MKTIVATAKTEQEVNEIWLAILAEQPYIEFTNINGLQVTIIYTPVAEVEAQREQADKEFWQKHAQPEAKPVKKRKQPRPIELQNKADSIGLSHLDIDRNDGIYTVSKKKYHGGEVLFSSKSGISVSRQLTKMAWAHAWKEYFAD